LCHAVAYLHNILYTHTNGKKEAFTGWHKDIKPRNILVKTHPGSTSGISFKLADFGLSHFMCSSPDDGDIVEFGNWGTRAYGDPESYRAERSEIKTKVDPQLADVWSLGCIYSEALVWSVYGYPELERYRRRRLLETSKLNDFTRGEYFHDGEKIMATVRAYHDRISSQHTYKAPSDISSLANSMLQPAWSRIDSKKASVLASGFTDSITALPSGTTRLVAIDDHQYHQIEHPEDIDVIIGYNSGKNLSNFLEAGDGSKGIADNRGSDDVAEDPNRRGTVSNAKGKTSSTVSQAERAAMDVVGALARGDSAGAREMHEWNQWGTPQFVSAYRLSIETLQAYLESLFGIDIMIELEQDRYCFGAPRELTKDELGFINRRLRRKPRGL
ncbi:hypothetical protein S7711_01569, partial [Stachybotrys chartarum IBT 7711]